MQPTPDAVTRQIVDDVVAALPRFGLNRAPDPIQQIPGLCRAQCF